MQDPAIVLTPDPSVMPITLVVLGIMIAIPIYFIVRFLRAYEKRSQPAPSDRSHESTIAELQNEVDVLRAEVARLTEAQDFTTQLLQDRPTRELNPIHKEKTSPNNDTPTG